MPGTNSPLVIIDLETSGMPKPLEEVIQIAAVAESLPSTSFNRYILPEHGVSSYVTGLTGFAVAGGALTLQGRAVDAGSRSAAVQALLKYLRDVRAAAGSPLVLVAHNNSASDENKLIALVDGAGEGNIGDLVELVRGFASSDAVFREALPERVASARKGDFKLKTLAKDFGVLDGVGPLHTADQDVIVLQRLITKLGVAQQLVSAAKPVDTFSAYKESTGGAFDLKGMLNSIKVPANQGRRDGDILKELRSKLPVIKTLEKAALKVKVKLPELVESAGWVTNSYVAQLDDQGSSLFSAREEMEDALRDAEDLAKAKKYADEAVHETDHMLDWLAITKDGSSQWTFKLQRGSGTWKGSFKVDSYTETGHPTLYSLLADGVLKKQNSKRSRSPLSQIKLMKQLEEAARQIKGPLEQLFMYLEFYRNKREEDLHEAMAQHLTTTRQQLEEVLAAGRAASPDLLENSLDLLQDALERDQYLADWLYLIGDNQTSVEIEVRRGGDLWTGKTSMKELTYSAQVLLFDVMQGEKIKRL